MKGNQLGFEEVRRAILESLTPELLDPKWRALVFMRAGAAPEAGHCAVAAEAFYHLVGGKEAGFMPVVCGYFADGRGGMVFGDCPATGNWHRETHWWLRGPSADGIRGMGAVYDLTAGQYACPFPYEKGKNIGFMQPRQQPSRRARIVMNRVAEKLGQERLVDFRMAMIESGKKRHARRSFLRRNSEY